MSLARNRLLGGLSALALLGAVQGAAAADATPAKPGVCWVEYGGGAAPGALGSEGATAPIWRNTASGLLVRHPRGDVLIDAGWSHAAADEVKEFAPAKAAVASRVLAALSWRTPAPQALARVGEPPESIATVLPTHGHFDHLAGAIDLPDRPILLSREEIQWLGKEKQQPDVAPLSVITALQSRFKPIAFGQHAYRGFAESFDVYGDGVIVIVPLGGHTPGSVGVFVNVGGKTYFDTGDATFTYEALERGSPKMKLLRDYADNDPSETGQLVQELSALHKAHPEVLMLPSHDRLAWEQAFGPSPTCVS